MAHYRPCLVQCSAELEALERVYERDEGDFTGQPTAPIIVNAQPPEEPQQRVSLTGLWSDYVAVRKQAGFMRDGGKRQRPVIEGLRKFLKHDDAARITKKDLLAWRDDLMQTNAAKTVSDVYLSAVRTLLNWAVENDRLSENVAIGLKQPKPRKVYSRERGYTDSEAVRVLNASRSYNPHQDENGYIREKPQLVAAKRWVPIICAFSGARVSEITQLRKEDIRQIDDQWVARITPDAGTVKAGGYRDVATGEIDNPEFLPILFQAEPDDDWRDEKVWHRANPGLKHGFPSMPGLRTLAKEAEHRPADKAAFLQFNLNVWQANSRDPLFDIAGYDARRFDDDPVDLEALPCWIGVDLAKNGDTSCVVAAWLHDDGQITIKPWFFVPGEDLKGRADCDGVPYEQWRDAGFLTATPGPIIDPEIVEDHIRELCATYDVQEVAFDPHLARRTMQNLLDDGLPIVEFRQAPLSMGVAIGDLERTVNGRLIRHDGHPVLRHHFDSVVCSRNDTGLVRMHKGNPKTFT